MAKKKVIVSFDYEHDAHYYRLMKAWDANDRFEFYINDMTPQEIQSESVDTIKQVLSKKIHDANYMIAIIGEHSNDEHPDSKKIGHKNWQAYEIAKNYEWGNKLVVVKIDSQYSMPIEACLSKPVVVDGFKEPLIVDALDSLSK